MRRMGLCNRLRPEKVEEYKALHAAVWPDVLACITACNIRNYSIFLRTPENLLFAYREYHGEDFKADARKMAAETPCFRAAPQRRGRLGSYLARRTLQGSPACRARRFRAILHKRSARSSVVARP